LANKKRRNAPTHPVFYFAGVRLLAARREDLLKEVGVEFSKRYGVEHRVVVLDVCCANSLPIPDEAPVTSAQGPNLFLSSATVIFSLRSACLGLAVFVAS
jgi:hypothetical protein